MQVKFKIPLFYEPVFFFNACAVQEHAVLQYILKNDKKSGNF